MPSPTTLPIGSYVYLPSPSGLDTLCRVRDVKNAYGNLRYRIEPVSGKGSAWVNSSTVEKAESPGLREDVWGVRS